MAVLRVARLFAFRANPGLEYMDPAESFEGGTPRDTTLYYCPWGSRAILRTATVTTAGNPVWNPQPYCHLKIWASGQPNPVAFFFTWFFDPNQPGNEGVALSHTWNGHLVMNEGDNIQLYNGTGTMLDVTGSGAVMPLP